MTDRLRSSDSARHSVSSVCRLLGVSKQAFYKHVDVQLTRLSLEGFVVEFIQEIRSKDPGIGGSKLWHMYRKRFGEKYSVGYNRFYDIIELYGLKVRRRKRRTSTTDSRHGLPLYPDLTRELLPSRPCQLIASDITYIPLESDGCFCFLSLVTDCYSREIVGYSVGDSLETRYPLEALEMALRRYDGEEFSQLIHHSDRGLQYASFAYTVLLKSHGVRISMTERGNPKDNAIAERVNGTIKNELLRGMSFNNVEDVRRAVAKAVDFYNNERPHWSIDGMTPAQASKCSGEISKMWTSYRDIAIKANEEKVSGGALCVQPAGCTHMNCQPRQ